MKLNPTLAFVLCFVCMGFFSCKKDTDPNMETFRIVKEEEKVITTTTTATISGTYDFSGKVNSIKVRVGTSDQLFGSDVFVAELSGKSYSVNITGLRSGTNYYYRYEVDYGAKEDYLTDISDFTTQSESPTVRTLEVQVIDSTTFRVKCVVDADGGSEVSERGICWNTYGDPTMDDETMQHTSGGVGQYTLRMENLPANTKYYVRAYAKNGTGIGFGEVLDFQTGGQTTKPQVSTVEVSGVTYNAAICLSNVSNDGGLELTERGVCWGLEPDPTVNVHKVTAEGTDIGNYTVTIEGLNPNTDYHVRAYAINEKGISYGEDLPFKTTEGKPTVTTAAVTDITATSATGGGNVTDEGASLVTERGICWSTSHEPTTSGDHASNGTGAGGYSCNMTGLVPNETYYVRAYATNGQGTAYGAEVEFTAKEGLPVVVTLDVTDITATTAKALGQVTDQGGSPVTERGVCWGTEPSPTISGSHANSGTGAGEYTVDLTGLAPGTTYYVRAYAMNAQGLTYGEEKGFATEATVPTVATGGINGTTVNGEVTADGGAAVTERGVCWGTSPAPTTGGSHASSGSGLGTFSVELTDLAPGTTYHVRAYATNSAGTSYGTEKTLTTEANPPTVTTGEVSNVQQTTAQGGGNVTDDGGAEVTERGVCWSTGHNPDINGSHAHAQQGGTGSFTVEMTGLTPNTTYYVRAYAINSAGIQYGGEKGFTTAQSISAPTVTTAGVTDITETTAMGGGEVTNDGGAQVTERGICWNTSQNPTVNSSHASSGTGTGSFTCNMTGLTAGTTYYVRAYAKNSAGTSYGNEVSFTTQQAVTLPTVTTAQVMNIQQTTAMGGGNVTADGGATVTERGICWSTSLNPTTSGSHVEASSGGTGTFMVSMTGLTANTTYYVRAYAKNNAGTTYGEEVSFTTLSGGGGNVPEGAINGLFTINSNGDQVYFSKGNLQYIGSANTPYWKFAEHQWDYLGDNGQGSAIQNGDRDLFGWGTSGYNHGAVCYQPWSTSTTQSDYFAYGQWTYHLYDQSGQADWGYNAISNGGNQNQQWRTLTMVEWSHVLHGRSTPSGKRYAKAQVNGVNGVILLPDNWSASYYSLSRTNISGASFSSNTITAGQWVTLQQHGAVFLPAAGTRNGSSVLNVGSGGYYWSASHYGSSNAYHAYSMSFNNVSLYSSSNAYRYNGHSVRLVYPAGN